MLRWLNFTKYFRYIKLPNTFRFFPDIHENIHIFNVQIVETIKHYMQSLVIWNNILDKNDLPRPAWIATRKSCTISVLSYPILYLFQKRFIVAVTLRIFVPVSIRFFESCCPVGYMPLCFAGLAGNKHCHILRFVYKSFSTRQLFILDSVYSSIAVTSL